MLTVSLALSGCKKANDVPGASNNSGDTAGEGVKVGLVLAGGLGDRSFYDSSHEGVEKAKKDFGIEYKVYECRNDSSLLNDQVVQASQYGSIVAVVGFEFFDVVQDVAKEFPDVNYIYVDNEIEGMDNLITVSYAENEGAFLAGALAAMLTTETSIEGIDDSKLIGMVGGMDIPVIRNYQIGFEAGAKYIDSEIEIQTTFAEDFEDPAKGKEHATVLYGRGADIIFQAAGKTGEGVFEAAAEHGKYAIGVDSDQRYINPNNIVASMIKEVGKSIYETIEKIQKDEVEKGKVVYYGLAQDGVGMAYGTDDMMQFATEDMKNTLEDIKAKIISGEITVPTGK
ncbi:BMP family ABC transporter substrate-binding protein [Tissierella sp. DSM 105185]|uniref:BMP family ABC transporter substrate-binding protein n=2 Tax=Tissierella pigra TaxID=2607614 RepID=A0A6N7XHA7_9FIRM|nr:BMP family ABC transporter substrate-binding protein [Tissierella pigra]